MIVAHARSLVLLVALLLAVIAQMDCVVDARYSISNNNNLLMQTVPSKSKLLTSSMRGGAVKPSKLTASKQQRTLEPKSPSIFRSFKEEIEKIKPATRAHLFLAVLCTLIHVTALPGPAPPLLGIDIRKLWQIWRPFTSVAYFGPPSLSMANSIYFLVRYGQNLETQFGTGPQAWFILTQVAMLSVLGLLFGFPFLARSFITACVYVSCSLNPMERMSFQFGLTIFAWHLPYCLMLLDCLSTQSMSAAWPHLLGIFTGHVYYFFTSIWPKLQAKEQQDKGPSKGFGKGLLDAPDWFLQLFGDAGGKPTSNLAYDYRQQQQHGIKKSTGRSFVSRFLSRKQQSNGRKLQFGVLNDKNNQRKIQRSFSYSYT